MADWVSVELNLPFKRSFIISTEFIVSKSFLGLTENKKSLNLFFESSKEVKRVFIIKSLNLFAVCPSVLPNS